jgi:hydrogenase/urease accessory protein HupE
MSTVCRSILPLLLLASSALAHPTSQGRLDITLHPDRIAVAARVSLEEVSVTNSVTGDDPLPGPWAAASADTYDRHAQYLASHLRVTADGTALTARVTKVGHAEEIGGGTVAYEFEYPLPNPPHRIELHHQVLADAKFAPGQSFGTSYIVQVSMPDRLASDPLLLTPDQPLAFNGDGSPATASRMFRDYFVHGVRHILSGYDHLLFISALVLAATTLWDLVKVVTAFTVAHTLTLTLAALNFVHLPERIVEPLIATSIVVVAAQNIIWPRRASRWRLAAAFFFGLFHGLGFAGGLLDAMQGMRGAVVLLAIAAFSLGVEAGHQLIVIPLFSLLKIARRSRPDLPAKDALSLRLQQFGSAAISLAGLFYLVAALR